MPPERVIRFRARTVLSVLAIVLAVAATLQLLWIARQVITWVLIAVFLALALNPLVELLMRRGVRRRGLAIGLAYVLFFSFVFILGGAFIPTLVDEIGDFREAVPGFVQDLTEGRGRLGFLQERYQIVDRVEEAILEADPARLAGFSGTAIAVTKGIVTVVIATITIIVMTFFMLLEGPGWVERFYGQLSPESQSRWRQVGHDIYLTVGGFVVGALMIATLAGVSSAILLSVLGVSYAFALALLVALLDLIPLAGAAIATVVVSTIALLDSGWVIGVVVLVYFVVYQQVENHLLYPIVYSRTVQLSPLAILIAVLVGASVAGILGALAAIPIAGAIQVLVMDWIRHRKPVDTPPEEAAAPL